MPVLAQLCMIRECKHDCTARSDDVTTEFLPCREDGPFCWVVNAPAIQGLAHGVRAALSQKCRHIRCVPHVWHHVQGNDTQDHKIACLCRPGLTGTLCMQHKHWTVRACILKPCWCLQGKETIPFLEKLVVGDIAGIENGSGSLTVFTNDKGGIIDDTVLTKVTVVKARRSCAALPLLSFCSHRSKFPPGVQVADDEVYLVINAGCRDKDIKHLQSHLKWFKVICWCLVCRKVRLMHSNPQILDKTGHISAVLLML